MKLADSDFAAPPNAGAFARELIAAGLEVGSVACGAGETTVEKRAGDYTETEQAQILATAATHGGRPDAAARKARRIARLKNDLGI